MIKHTLVAMMLLFAMTLLWAPSAAAETPQEGAKAILTLLKERNYTDLFQKRYSEWYKAEAEGMKPEAAIERLSARWEKNHDMMVKLYEQLASSEFELSKNEMPQETETGDIATAMVSIGEKKVPYCLYKMKSGLWGFHL